MRDTIPTDRSVVNGSLWLDYAPEKYGNVRA
jgi:hypothetical protein